MMTLRQLVAGIKTVPVSTAWYLADLAEAMGKQQLFTRTSPQKLQSMRRHALIESAVSSNRIEGVEVEPSRAATVVLGKHAPRDRNEEEVRGYREALDLIHAEAQSLTVSEEIILRLHAIMRGDVWDAGKYKERPSDIIEHLPGGGSRVRFSTVVPEKTREAMAELINLHERCLVDKLIHPLIAAAAFNLDFLCIHPFRDGNGRVSRLLLLLQTYKAGVEVGRYVSLERLIEQNLDRYYETLEISSQQWHDGKHDAWPYINYLLFVLKHAYAELEGQLDDEPAEKGSKAMMIRAAINKQAGTFRIGDIERECPGVGREWIRTQLGAMRKAGELRCEGRGPAARWSKAGSKGSTLK